RGKPGGRGEGRPPRPQPPARSGRLRGACAGVHHARAAPRGGAPGDVRAPPRRVARLDPRHARPRGLPPGRGGPCPRGVRPRRRAALDRGSADAWANLGALALGWRDYGGAERAYRRASELEPWAVESRLHLAEALAAQAPENPAKAGAAAAAYREVLARAPGRPQANCGAGGGPAEGRKAAPGAG